mmetsp:Transcript_49025/g.129591  ORF Transcript_49025/g.129591 Transcript_49025/m.129591 type:complete len:212 (+) Transcript_49025:78-713(+)
MTCGHVWTRRQPLKEGDEATAAGSSRPPAGHPTLCITSALAGCGLPRPSPVRSAVRRAERIVNEVRSHSTSESIAALATAASCAGRTPETPHAPMMPPCFGSMMGMPPSMRMYWVESRAERCPLLPLTPSSRSFVSRANLMAEIALPVATSEATGMVPSMRCRARRLPPASVTATHTLKPSFSASLMPAATAMLAPFRVSLEKVAKAISAK